MAGNTHQDPGFCYNEQVMAAYKVLQDIEAEDKLVGPMTARQLLYAGVASGFLFIGYLVGDKTSWWAMVAFLVPALPFIYLAAPLGQDQPNDIWLLAKLNYFLRPRKRTWHQAGKTQRVIIKSKASPARPATSRDTGEVIESRLKALAHTLDSHPSSLELSGGGLVSGSPVIDPYSSEEHPTAGRFDGLLGAYQAQAQLNSQTRLQAGQIQNQAGEVAVQPPPNQAIINQLAGADDLKVATIAALANQSDPQQGNQPPPN